ncbi:unnamed protein product [Dibothriocephalus latus]|uniref:PIG-P domain-containing protein n=1 Tax=Dibothriocephalus latus TaxID=60516 RepID=A0A3P7LFR1_DIBLA|nr:unnamed protein product [Dibothriocephalus latus]
MQPNPAKKMSPASVNVTMSSTNNDDDAETGRINPYLWVLDCLISAITKAAYRGPERSKLMLKKCMMRWLKANLSKLHKKYRRCNTAIKEEAKTPRRSSERENPPALKVAAENLHFAMPQRVPKFIPHYTYAANGPEADRQSVTLPKSDTSPGPVTKRAVYGFATYIIAWALFGSYIIWAYVPHEYLVLIGLTYLPSRVWAIIVPWGLIALLFGGVGIYLYFNGRLVLPQSSIHLLYGEGSRKILAPHDTNSELPFVFTHDYDDPEFQERQRILAYTPQSVVLAPTLDVSLDWVNRQLYLSDNNKRKRTPL